MARGPDIIEADAIFAASAVARLVRVLHRKGVIDDGTLGELAEVAADFGRIVGTPMAIRAMEVVQAQLGSISAVQKHRMAEQDAIEEADPTPDETDDEPSED